MLTPLLNEVADARARYLNTIERLTEPQSRYKPSPEVWSPIEITEHLYWAEHGGIWGMWRALQAYRDGTPVWSGAHTNQGKSIEAIVAETWQEKEQVPATAAPRMGGTLAFWAAALASLQQPLEAFSRDVTADELDRVIHPHPISGPLDIPQRLDFLRFHIDRHRGQVESLFA
jgi:hypothetical protein